MLFLRRRGSTQVGGRLTCPRCDSANLKFIETQGFEVDIYKCRVCNTPIRYMTTPLKSRELMDTKFGGRPARGTNPQESMMLPGIGKFRVRKA